MFYFKSGKVRLFREQGNPAELGQQQGLGIQKISYSLLLSIYFKNRGWKGSCVQKALYVKAPIVLNSLVNVTSSKISLKLIGRLGFAFQASFLNVELQNLVKLYLAY